MKAYAVLFVKDDIPQFRAPLSGYGEQGDIGWWKNRAEAELAANRMAFDSGGKFAVVEFQVLSYVARRVEGKSPHVAEGWVDAWVQGRGRRWAERGAQGGRGRT